MRFGFLAFLAAAAAFADNRVQDPGAPWPGNVDLPRATAMGGAHAAIATSNDALTVNPAGLAQARRYHFELDGLYDSKYPAQAIMVSFADSITTAPAATGLLFSRWASGQPAGRGEGWSIGFGYAGAIGQSVWAGGETKFFHVHTPDGLVQKFAQDVGLLTRRGNFAIAAVLQNISTEKIPLFPLTASGGIAWGTDADWHLAFDYRADLSDTSNVKNRFNGGAELLLGDSMVARAGGTWDSTARQWFISGGFGILTEKGGLQITWRRRVEGPYDQFFEGGLTIYLE
jgi:hypothetical protein